MLGLGGNISSSAPVGVVGVSTAYYIADFNNDTIDTYYVDTSVVDAEGETGVLALSNSTNASFSLFLREPFGGILGGKTYSVTFEYFVPTESPLTDFDLYKNYGYLPFIDGPYTKGQWVTITSNFTATNANSYAFLNFRLKSSTSTYSGDLIYVKNITIENVVAPPVSGLNPAPDYIDIDVEAAAYPAAAYNLRTLFSFSPTYLIRVRRASDNAEQDIGFDYTGSLDTSALATFCAGTNGYVVRWYDQSSNGNDAVQATTSAQPQIVSSGSVLTDNGKPSLNFNGSCSLETTYQPQLGTASAVHTHTYLVASQSTTHRGSIWRSQGTVDLLFQRFDSSKFQTLVRDSNSVITNVSSSVLSQSVQYLLHGEIDAGTVSNYVNGVIDGVASPSFTGDLDLTSPFYIGSHLSTSDFLQGNISELIFYSSDQSANRTAIETNINDFYSIY